MFEYEDGICKKIKNSGCLDAKELQAVEIALRLTACHDMILNEALGLENKQGGFDFDLKHAIHKDAKSSR